MFWLRCSNLLRGFQLPKSVRIWEEVFVLVIQIGIWEKAVKVKYLGVIFTFDKVQPLKGVQFQPWNGKCQSLREDKQ